MGSLGGIMSISNLDCGYSEYHRICLLALTWLEGAFFRKDFKNGELGSLDMWSPAYKEWGRNFTSFLWKRFQLGTVPSLHTNVLFFFFLPGVSNSHNQPKPNQTSHQGTKRILLGISSFTWNLHINTSEASFAWYVWTLKNMLTNNN